MQSIKPSNKKQKQVTMSAVQVKLYLQPQSAIRRVTIDTNTTFEQFQEQVKSFYPEHVQTLGFQYVDDEEDLVSFSSNNEWNAALTGHAESKAALLRIKVKPTSVNRPQPQPRPQRPWFFGQHCQRPQLEEKDIEAYINKAAPFLKQLLGIDIQIEKEEEKPQQAEQPVEKKEAPQQAEEQVEEIVIPEDEPVEQVYPTIESPQEKPVEAEPVVESKPVEQAPVVEAPVETKPVEQYAEQLETLANMGFTNEKLNKHLLENFKGDLIRVVNSLVQLSLKQ